MGKNLIFITFPDDMAFLIIKIHYITTLKLKYTFIYIFQSKNYHVFSSIVKYTSNDHSPFFSSENALVRFQFRQGKIENKNEDSKLSEGYGICKGQYFYFQAVDMTWVFIFHSFFYFIKSNSVKIPRYQDMFRYLISKSHLLSNFYYLLRINTFEKTEYHPFLLGRGDIYFNDLEQVLK